MTTKIILKNIHLEFKNNNTSLKDLFIFNQKKTKPKDGLKDINLEIRRGEKVGIIGSNGAGKSTLLRIISGIYFPDSGSVEVSGKVAPLIELGVGFNGEMTGEENVMLSGVLLGATLSEIKDRIDEIFKFAELEDYRDTLLKYYSTGMGMRLSFSLATSIKPEILILDEIFAGGDASFVKKASKRMNEMIDNAQILLMVSHNIHQIKLFCNRVIWLENGGIKRMGSVEEICAEYDSAHEN
jgi:ABC-type polysaccharide/polyol phosphate transport system ATPase subunit